MIRSFLCRNGSLVTDITRDQMKSFLAAPDGHLWVDLEGPNDEEYAILSEVFRFHPLAVEDAHKEIELPKADVYDGYVYLVVHRINVDFQERRVTPREMDIFLSDRYLVTVHDEVSVSAAAVASRIQSLPSVLAAGPDIVMHDIIDRIVDRYLPFLDRWEDEIDDLEETILAGKIHDHVLEKALDLRRQVAELRKSLGPQRDMILRLSRRDIPHISEKAALYFRDVQDHLVRIFQTLETHRDHIASLFEAYMATSSNRLNMVMKRLTSFATIFLPLSFLAGLYGMNFAHMPGLGHPYGFFAAVGAMGLVAAGMLWYFRMKRWW